jgi:peptidoglycan/xylan/chitin deacetylase (PgdA/CDA1 family)
VNTPVFIYHGFYEDVRTLAEVAPEARRYYLPRESLAQHLDFLHERRLEALSFQEWTAGPAPRAGAVLLTFDDAHRSNYEMAWPMLAARGMRATFFAVAEWVGRPRRMTAAELREVRQAGITVGSHGFTHTPLTGLAQTDLDTELRRSKEVLEDLLGAAVDILAIPGGFMNRLVAERAAAAGYRHVCTSQPGWGSPNFLVNRLSMTSATPLSTFRKLAQGSNGELRKMRFRYHARHTAKRFIGVAGYEWLYHRFGSGARSQP